MKSRATALEAIEKKLRDENPQKKKVWFDLLPPELQQDIMAVKDKYRSNGYANSMAQIARAVADVAAQHLALRPSQEAVARWLKN
jgi:hypothetical protein